MNKHFINLLLLFMLLNARSQAQANAYLDSLKKIISSGISDSLKFEKTKTYAWVIRDTHGSAGVEFGKAALNYVEHTNISHPLKENLRAFFTAYLGDSEYEFEAQDNTKRVEAYVTAEEMYRRAGSTFEYANLHRLIGRIYYLQGDYAKGYQYLEESKKIADSTGDKRILLKVYWQYEDFSSQEGNLAKTLEYDQKILSLSRELYDTVSIAKCFENLGNDYSGLKNYGQAQLYYLQAEHWLGMIEDSVTLSEHFRDMGANYSAQHQSAQALDCFSKSLSIDLRLKSAWAEEEDYRYMSNEYDSLRNYKQSLQYYRIYSALHDSQTHRTYSASSAEAEAKYETEKKDHEIQLIKKDREAASLQLKREVQKRVVLIAAFLALAVITFLLFNRYQLRKKIEQQNAILEERNRIGSDMHDELGSGLSKIALLSEVLKKNADNQQSQINIEKISFAAYEALEKISEIVWSLNPKNDTLENLISYIRRYAVEYFEPTGIVCLLNLPATIPHTSLSGDERRNIFLAFKEALHNVVKHAEATEVKIRIERQEKSLIISIHDNGKGLPPSLSLFGNGLSNMKKRMSDAGGVCEIENHDGTRVAFSIPVK